MTMKSLVVYFQGFLILGPQNSLPNSDLDSRWVATRRDLTKPVSLSPPFNTGLVAFTALILTVAGQINCRMLLARFTKIGQNSFLQRFNIWNGSAYQSWVCQKAPAAMMLSDAGPAKRYSMVLDTISTFFQ